jgi:hypothetical protein
VTHASNERNGAGNVRRCRIARLKCLSYQGGAPEHRRQGDGVTSERVLAVMDVAIGGPMSSSSVTACVTHLDRGFPLTAHVWAQAQLGGVAFAGLRLPSWRASKTRATSGSIRTLDGGLFLMHWSLLLRRRGERQLQASTVDSAKCGSHHGRSSHSVESQSQKRNQSVHNQTRTNAAVRGKPPSCRDQSFSR